MRPGVAKRISTRLAVSASACAISVVLATNAVAACRINGVSDVAFGDYNVFALASNIDGVGNLSIRCTGGSSATVQLSRGLSGNFAPRTMRYGNRVLYYNLYTTAARNTVWGDGSGGTSVVYVGKNQNGDLDVFGSIPAGQDAAVGNYIDTIIVTINF